MGWHLVSVVTQTTRHEREHLLEPVNLCGGFQHVKIYGSLIDETVGQTQWFSTGLPRPPVCPTQQLPVN